MKISIVVQCWCTVNTLWSIRFTMSDSSISRDASSQKDPSGWSQALSPNTVILVNASWTQMIMLWSSGCSIKSFWSNMVAVINHFDHSRRLTLPLNCHIGSRGKPMYLAKHREYWYWENTQHLIQMKVTNEE